MTSYEEEQDMEAQALSAIYDSAFKMVSPTCWSVTLRPVDTGGDPHETAADDTNHTNVDDDELNHVAVQLIVTLTPEYPLSEAPQLEIKILKGLTTEHAQTLMQIAQQEASSNIGMPIIYTICESIKSWLVDHNQKGLDDTSMHAQMMRKIMQAQKMVRFCRDFSCRILYRIIHTRVCIYEIHLRICKEHRDV